MTDDIVTRIRNAAIDREYDDYTDYLLVAAADEIERLTEWHKNALLALDKRETEIERLRAALDCAVSELLPVHDHYGEFDHDEVLAHFLEEARREQ